MIKDATINQLFQDAFENKNAKVISYGISDKYVPNWTETQALTEYVANFYDENGTDFTISELEDGIVLEDMSEKGILLQDLVVGNSSSREYSYKIGTHGEGFKLGALVLVRNGKKVIIETIGNTIIFFLDNDTKLNSNILKSKIIPNNRTKGSRIFLETQSLKDVNARFLFLNKTLTKCNDFLYTNETNKQNHIYVNTLAAQPIQSFFSYSLFKKQLVNRDRNMLESPYEDILLELFNSKDKNMIREWLSCLSKENFLQSFEYELLQYLYHNNRRKVFKEIDFTLFKEIASELNMRYIGNRNEFEIKTLPITNPNHQLTTANSYSIADFFEKKLERPMHISDLQYGFYDNGLYKLPIRLENDKHKSNYQQIIDFYHRLDNSSLLKEARAEKNVLTFYLKKDAEKKVDFLNGKTSKTNKHIQRVFESLYSFSDNLLVEFTNLPYGMETINKTSYISMASFPNPIQVAIYDNDLLAELNQNILFSKSSVILKNKAYKLDNGKTFELEHDFSFGKETDACFSYVKVFDCEYDLLENGKVVNALLERVKKEPKLNRFYELKFIDSIISEKESFKFNAHESKLKKTLNEQFTKVFGSKSVVSSSETGDKKARYNGYQLIELPHSLKNYFLLLGVKLSDNVRGSAGVSYDILKKPHREKFDEYLSGAYKECLKAALTLNHSLIYLYEMTRGHETDKQFVFANAILPYFHPSSDLNNRMEGRVVLNHSNYKKVIKEYSFEILERTYLVKSFDKKTTEGVTTEGQIYIKHPLKLGTFMHEYVHLSTNFLDICPKFERTLSLVNLITHQFRNPTDKEINAYFNEYKKWLGVQ